MPVPAIAAGALKAAPYILQGMSALGGIFGKKKKYMDSETLRQLYGPRAIAKDTQELANYILNSPYGQQLLAAAAEQGQGLQTEMAARAAASGLSPDTGGQSGASDFQVSAATQAQTGLERQTKAGIYSSAMPIAADMVSGRMQVALAQQGEQNAQPSTLQRLGAAAGQVAAGMPAPGATSLPTNAIAQAATTPTSMVPRPIATPQAAMPQVDRPVPVPQRQHSPMQAALTTVQSGGMRRGLSRRG